MIEIQPRLQIVYLGNGCEGYSPGMFLPAKTNDYSCTDRKSQRIFLTV